MLSCTYTFRKNDYDFYTSADVVNIRTTAFFGAFHIPFSDAVFNRVLHRLHLSNTSFFRKGARGWHVASKVKLGEEGREVMVIEFLQQANVA